MGLTGGDNHGLKGPALDRERRSIGPRTAKALRLMLGLTMTNVATQAGVSSDLVERVEVWPIVDWEVAAARRAISDTFAALGGHWCEAATHDGVHCVYLSRGNADDRQAVLALMALMPVTIAALFRRVTAGKSIVRPPGLVRWLRLARWRRLWVWCHGQPGRRRRRRWYALTGGRTALAVKGCGRSGRC